MEQIKLLFLYKMERKYLEYLQAVYDITSETNVPASIVELEKRLPHVKAPTLYSRASYLAENNYLNKNKYNGRVAVTCTIKGNKTVIKNQPSVVQSEGVVLNVYKCVIDKKSESFYRASSVELVAESVISGCEQPITKSLYITKIEIK